MADRRTFLDRSFVQRLFKKGKIVILVADLDTDVNLVLIGALNVGEFEGWPSLEMTASVYLNLCSRSKLALDRIVPSFGSMSKCFQSPLPFSGSMAYVIVLRVLLLLIIQFSSLTA